MAPTGDLIGLLVGFVVLTTVQGQVDQCDLPTDWQFIWWVGYNESDSQFELFNATTRSEYLESTSATKSQSTCEEDETYFYYYDYGVGNEVEYNTIATFKRMDDNKRFCFDGIVEGNVMLYRQSDPVSRNDAYSIDACEGLIGEPTAYNFGIKYVNGGFSFGSAVNDIPIGTYTFTYENGDDTERCQGDGSAITVTSTTLNINSCFNGTVSYQHPLQGTFRIVGTINDDQLRLDSSEFGGMVVLAYDDPSAPLGSYFYLARYEVPRDDGASTDPVRLEFLLTTDQQDSPIGYLSPNYISASVKAENIIYYYVESTECDSSPCINGGTCRQLWIDFECFCPDGFTAKTCNDDTNECLAEDTPCNGNGDCVDELNDFSCDCDDGWGGDYCDERDPCNPHPCNYGFCFPLNDEDFFCDCPNDTFGFYCEFSDFCANGDDLCENGGTCYLGGPDGYWCDCRIGWEGDNCEDMTSTGSPPPPGGICSDDGDCENAGVCVDGRCQCSGYWTGVRCQEVSQWFIVSIALIVLLVIILIVILIVCCCYCTGRSTTSETSYRDDQYVTRESKSMDGMSGYNTAGPAPGTVQFSVLSAPSATSSSVLR